MPIARIPAASVRAAAVLPILSILPILVLLPLAGCADDLTATPGPADGAALPPVSSVRAGDTVTTTVDATGSETWLHFDFETGAQAPAPEAGAGRAWDLAFQRFKVRANGGVSGQAGVEVAVLQDRTLEGLDSAPTSGWLLDGPDGPDMNPDPDTVFNQGEDTWFSYDSNTHVLSPKPRVYVVRTADDGFFAVQLLSYYDPAGNPGFLQFRWKPVTAAATRAPATVVMAADGGAQDGAGN